MNIKVGDCFATAAGDVAWVIVRVTTTHAYWCVAKARDGKLGEVFSIKLEESPLHSRCKLPKRVVNDLILSYGDFQ